jgi:hypothetical protein
LYKAAHANAAERQKHTGDSAARAALARFAEGAAAHTPVHWQHRREAHAHRAGPKPGKQR